MTQTPAGAPNCEKLRAMLGRLDCTVTLEAMGGNILAFRIDTKTPTYFLVTLSESMTDDADEDTTEADVIACYTDGDCESQAWDIGMYDVDDSSEFAVEFGLWETQDWSEILEVVSDALK